MRRLRIFPRLAVYITVAFSVACGGSSSPTAPSVPQVAGTYAGTVTIFYPEIGRSLSCPTTTIINQTGSAISIAPLILGGQCSGISVPLGEATIDANGSIGSESGTLTEPTCGTYQYSASGGFFGRQFQFAMTATSRTCLSFNLTGTLTR